MFMRFSQSEDKVGENSNEECRTNEQRAKESICKSALSFACDDGGVPKLPESLAEIMVNRRW